MAHEEISEVARDGRYLRLNGSRFATCANPEQAETLSGLIDHVSHASVDGREQIIRDWIDSQFDSKMAARTLKRVENLITGLRRTCSAFFMFLFIAVPIMVGVYGLTQLIVPIAGIMFMADVIICLRFVRAHRAIYPRNRSARVTDVVKMVLCPPAAIRAVDLLTLNAMSQFHPVLLSDLVLGPADTAFVGAVVRDLNHPLRCEPVSSEAVSIATWYANAELDACAKLLQERDADSLKNILTPPSWDGVSVTYCPRCLCQYAIGSGDCPDCYGVSLLPLRNV